MFLIIFGLSSWFYIRNLNLYRNPLIMNADFKHMRINQPPGYRNLSFYTDLTAFFKMDLLYSHYYSFIPGTYFSWYYDGHHTMLPVQEFSKIGVVLILLSIPITIFFILGVIRQFPFRNRSSKLLLLYLILLGINYFYITLKYPHYSSVKGYYLLSGIIPWIYFIVKGVGDRIHDKRFQFMCIVFSVVWIAVIMKNFWIQDFWYLR